MMSWTLDILLMSDPNFKRDYTDEWEAEIERQKGPKIKFPIKATAENIDPYTTDFPDPKIPAIKEKKKERKTDQPRTVELTKSKRKNNSKNKLF